MQVEYDQVADAVYFRLRGEKVVESVEISDGVVVDYDAKGDICGIEILAFSKKELDLNRLVKLRDEELVAEVATA
ncbi:DUF2283 domain-containing protein [Candidatus Thorarchaeota archaeon]|nr:MAG: DUF2283 domain-containing protein [Candidatus Thorarchaeota archaeon]